MTRWMMVLTLLVALIAEGARAEVTSLLDWKECGSDRMCYAAGSCLNSAKSEPDMLYLHLDAFTALNASGCPLMVQTRNIVSKTVYLIEIMRPGLADSGQGQQVEVLLQANTDTPSLLVACKANGDRVELIETSGRGYIASFKIELFENLSFFDHDHIICAFSIERLEQMKKELRSLLNSGTIGFRYRANNSTFLQQTDPMTERRLLFNDQPSCDPYAFQDSALVAGFRTQSVRNRHRSYLNCDKYDASYLLHYQYKTREDDVVKTLKCVEEKWIIEYTNGSISKPIEDIEEYSFWCAAKISQACTGPPLHCDPPHCPLFTAGTNASDALLTCPGGKWRMEWPSANEVEPDVEYYANLTMECKQHDVLQNEAAFFYTIEGAEQQLPETARCFTEYNCEEYAGLFYSDCDESIETCRELDRSNGKMQCKSREGDKTPATLTVREAGSNETSDSELSDPFTASFYTCDADDGQWKDEGGRAIPRYYTVSCEVSPDEGGMMGGISVINWVTIVLFTVAALLIVALAIFCARRCYRQNKARFAAWKIGQSAWKKMNTSARLRYARFVFAKIREQKVDFKHAFNVIEMALETETEEPEIWEECYNFISNLQGTLSVVDFGMLGMLNRYLYTQGKRIIEKHGWFSPHRITKANPKGLIRVVGIKLLLRSLLHSKQDDAEEILLEGLMRLSKEEHATEQYPHCGVLWLALTQVHFERRTTKTPEAAGNYWEHRTAYWYTSNLLKLLEKYLSETSMPSLRMEESEQIEAFGSPFEQAVEALGAAESNANHVKHQDGFFDKAVDPSVLRRYLRGVEHSLSTDIGRHFIPESFKKERVDALRELLRSSAAPFAFLDEQIDRWMRAVIAHNRSLDAHFLDQHLRTGEKLPGDKYFEMKKDHERFVDYTKAQSREIRKWFSQRIPISDLNFYFEKGVKKSREHEFKPPKPAKQSKGGGAKPQPPCALDEDSPFKELAGAPRSEWKKVPIVRQKTSPLTPVEREKYTALVEATLARDTVLGAQMHYAARDVVEVMRKARELLRHEPVMIEDLKAPIIVVGDLHGQIPQLDRLFRTRARDGKPGYLCDKYLFMGDYVDRETQSLEIVMCLFMLKLLYPDNFFLLRGNHETLNINHFYGFRTEMKQRYPDGADAILYALINEAFWWLSISAIIDNTYYCVHGCVSTNFFSRLQLRGIYKPIKAAEETAIVHDSLWCDPMKGDTGTTHNFVRACCNYIGAHAMAQSAYAVDCSYIIRGHEMMKEGFSIALQQVLTVFSCHNPEGNDACVLVVDAKKPPLSLIKFKFNALRARRGPALPPAKDDAPTKYERRGTGAIQIVLPFMKK